MTLAKELLEVPTDTGEFKIDQDLERALAAIIEVEGLIEDFKFEGLSDMVKMSSLSSAVGIFSKMIAFARQRDVERSDHKPSHSELVDDMTYSLEVANRLQAIVSTNHQYEVSDLETVTHNLIETSDLTIKYLKNPLLNEVQTDKLEELLGHIYNIEGLLGYSFNLATRQYCQENYQSDDISDQSVIEFYSDIGLINKTFSDQLEHYKYYHEIDKPAVRAAINNLQQLQPISLPTTDF
ncbi:hypothetical protein CR969_00710 [Candidatus Saccharibacteria bacterium]|nr:MAG: hypothetical protein CR969_00710 [Candidatus Saccharibacteria bacterium]